MEHYESRFSSKGYVGCRRWHRKLFRDAEAGFKELSDADLEEFSKSFEAFKRIWSHDFQGREAILLDYLKPSARWLAPITEESDAYGYAIAKPTAPSGNLSVGVLRENTETYRTVMQARTYGQYPVWAEGTISSPQNQN